MSLSKLNKCLIILKVLVIGPQKIDSITYGVKMGRISLKNNLDFLVSIGLVEERRHSDEYIVYAINERGLSVFETLKALKYIEKLICWKPRLFSIERVKYG